jgi:hypothetical protein
MKSYILQYLIKKAGGPEKFIRELIEEHLSETHHLSKNPRRRISDEVMSKRLSA